jgi:hypothetical protein
MRNAGTKPENGKKNSDFGNELLINEGQAATNRPKDDKKKLIHLPLCS